MSINLKQLSVGDSGRVVGFGEGSKAYRRKLLSLGLTPGTELTVTRYAPMGDPVEIRVRGFSLSLRRDEAASLLVEKTQ
ncbi:FeoA family protein [Lentisalinibacter sediminis]|uniref:FeoA family protein n=1 Tax=Lentisalinibacter sediminis TaxID=2992237 RepID=UPI00386D5483